MSDSSKIMQSAPQTTVKVAVRVRPMAAKELLANSKDCVEIIPGTQQLIVGGGPSASVGTDTIYSFTQKSFTFDYLFDENSRQEDLYTLSVAPLVDRFLEGFNATILAYGQTGSGKTYSMGIGLEGITPPDITSKGIVPRSITTIFKRIAAAKLENSTFEATVSVSFMELYNEELIDLLNPRPKSASAASSGPTIREDGTGKIKWVNLSEEKVNSTVELLSVLQKGSLCRTTGSTDMNASSSRSHAIFSVTLRQSSTSMATEADPNSGGDKISLMSKFHFVDLAGSERLKRTNAEGDRKKEGISINQGLLALGNVISALGDETRKTGHVPYRDSKLTRGNSLTLMLACVSPSDLNYGETVNTLHYANRARNIKNRVAINQDWGNSAGGEAQREIKSLRITIAQLRTEIAMIRAGGIEIRDAEAESMSSISNLVGQTKLQYHQRRERDHLAEVEKFKSESSNNSFQLDRFHFLCVRLAKQVRTLMDETTKLTIDRDQAIAAKCEYLNANAGSGIGFGNDGKLALAVSFPPEKKQRTSREQSPEPSDTPKRSRSPAPKANVNPIIRQYVTTISQLRLQLADCEDKLAWQYEAMSKLGQKGTKSNLAWSIQSLRDLDISTEVTTKRQDELRLDNARPGLEGERSIMNAIRENIELSTKRNEYASEDHGFHRYISLSKELANSSNPDLPMDGEDDDEPTRPSMQLPEDHQGPDIYMLINKLQNDIVQHEALAESIQKREAEYNMMQKAYESKLSVLQTQMVQYQSERDLALTRMTNGSKQQRFDVKTRFEEAKRRIDSEISDTQRKLGENSRLQSNSKSRAEKLTSELQATISALKGFYFGSNAIGEKTRMLQELRSQTQKHRDSDNAKMREISKLRRKEKNTSDIAKRLERSNQLQRLMIKKRNQEVVQGQQKLKQIMQSLKRAATPNKVIKPHGSGFTSPIPRNLKSARGRAGALSGAAMNEILASVNSPVRVSVSHTIMETRPDIDLRARFKKQMVDKELAATVLIRKSQKTHQQFQKVRNRLIEEQKELIAERKRVVISNFKVLGIHDEKSPQYMDERVRSIDVEVASIDNSMIDLEEKLKQNSGVLDSGFIGDSSVADLNWENALNLLRSLDRVELEATVAYFLEDVVSLRSLEDEYVQELESKEQTVANLKQQLQEVQESLYSQMKKRSVNFADQTQEIEDTDIIVETVGNVLLQAEGIPTDIDDNEFLAFTRPHLPRLGSSHSTDTEVMQIEDSLKAPLAVRIPSPTRKNGMRPITIASLEAEELEQVTIRAKPGLSHKEILSPVPKKDRPLSPVKELPRAFSPSIKLKEELTREELSTLSLQSIHSEIEESRPKKRYDLMTMGATSDVFQRLANAHTQASQAKVIQRNSIDKEALMQEVILLPHPESKRKSLTEMENNWTKD